MSLSTPKLSIRIEACHEHWWVPYRPRLIADLTVGTELFALVVSRYGLELQKALEDAVADFIVKKLREIAAQGE